MSTLKDFIAEVKGGMARNAFFGVMVKLPAILTNENFLKPNLAKVMLFCEQAQLPGMILNSAQVRTTGEFREVPFEKFYEPIMLSFYVDNEMIIKTMFDKWLDRIQNVQTRIHEWPVNYITEIDIFTYDKTNKQKYQVTLRDAFPKTVNAVQLDYNSKEIMRLQVSFSYKNYITTKLDQAVKYDSIPTAYLNNFSLFQNKTGALAMDL